MPEIHAKLSASGSKRWMTCPGSVTLEKDFPETSSPFAAEGTRAHAFAEQMLNLKLKDDNDGLQELTETIRESDPEMAGFVWEYVNYCMDVFNKANEANGDALMGVEERLNFTNVVPGGFGTGDCLVASGDTVNIIDLKYGKGVPVSAVNNPQLRLYGLGAIRAYNWIYKFKTVKMHIMQPRLENLSVEVMSVRDLRHWTVHEVKPKAIAANSGILEFVPSKDGCRFCKARGVCAARANYILTTVANAGREE